jgi:PAS domain S-box-containing protein
MLVPAPEYELAQFFDFSRDLFCIAGFDGYYKLVNASFERVLGYSREELMSRPFMELVHPDDVERAHDVLAVLATGEDVIGFESRLICADGSVRRFEWNTRTMPHLGVVYGIARDVTVRTALAEEQAALRRVATLVARERPPEEVFASVVEEVGRVLGVADTVMWRYEPDGSATVVAVWTQHGSAPLRLGARMRPGGRNVASLVLATGRPARIDDFSTATGSIGERMHAAGIGSAVGAPIVVEGRIWGAMIVATRESGPLPTGTESRIEKFTELVATAISNMQARSDLAASRARIVAATDEERRRVVRDLHDGAQQRLVHAVITLKQARSALQNDQEAVPGLVSEALDHAEGATAELRELAHGILPAVLTRGGLRAGVQALTARMPLPVTNGVSVGRLPAAVEATAYFVVCEALTNVAKHARAEHAGVTARIEQDTLTVQVRDDGVGGARPEGSGLQGLGDRLAALDGRLQVKSPPDGGTLVAAAIPIPPSAIKR